MFLLLVFSGWGKTPGHAFVDPDQCMPPCADASYPKACSVGYGAIMPDCDRERKPS